MQNGQASDLRAGQTLPPGCGLGSLEVAEAGRLRSEVLNSLGNSYGQLIQDGHHGSELAQRGNKEEMWRCSSASSQISLPAMRDGATSAPLITPSQIDLQVCSIWASPVLNFKVCNDLTVTLQCLSCGAAEKSLSLVLFRRQTMLKPPACRK